MAEFSSTASGAPASRVFIDQDGDFHLNGAAFYNDAEADISASLEVLNDLAPAELNFLDGAAAGSVIASLAVIADSNGAIADAGLTLTSTNEINIQIGGIGLLALDDSAISSNAAATDTAGKDCYVETQDAGGTATAAKDGGLYNFKTGDGSTSTGAFNGGAGGALSWVSGAGGPATGTGSSGKSGGAGAAIDITGGVGGLTDDDAAGELGGNGCTVTITAGNGGLASAGTAGGGGGGDIILASGTGGTSSGGAAGDNGNVISRGQTFLQKKLDDPIGAAATISTAELLGGIIVATPTGDGDAYTTPTGAQISALFTTTPTVGDSFELTIVNIAATNKTVELTAGASGMTVTGEATIENVTDGVAAGVASSGTFIFVNTGSDTWVAYRK